MRILVIGAKLMPAGEVLGIDFPIVMLPAPFAFGLLALIKVAKVGIST